MANVTNIEIRAQDKTTTAFRKVNAGLSRLDGKLKTTTGNLGLMNGGMGKLAGLMGGVIGVAAITNYAKNLLTVGDRLQKVSLQLGISVPKLQAYQFAASQSGVNTEALNTALNKFNTRIGEAALRTPESTTAFTNLGISIFDTNGELKESPKLLEEASDKIAGMKSPAEKSAAAVALFGKAGVDMLPLLNLGAEGVKAYEQTLVDAGAVISQDAADDISTFNDKIDLLSRTFQATFVPVLVAVLPALTLLAENFDTIAEFVGIAASAFLVAKIPALIGGITSMVTGLTLAIALNPIGAIAVAVTALGVAAYTYSENISEFFGFAETASEDLKDIEKETRGVEKAQKDLAKVEVKRNKIAEKFVKTSKKDVIPNLKKLEEGLGETQLKFVNLTGREGLGGIQLAFRNFFMNVWADATFYLGGTSQTIKTNFSNMKQDFEEFFKALDNIVIFEGNDVKNAFSAVMRNLEDQLKDFNGVQHFAKLKQDFEDFWKKLNTITYWRGQDVKNSFTEVMEDLEAKVKALKTKVSEITIAVPATAFSFANTKVNVPSTIFNVTSVTSANAKINKLVADINSFSYSDTTRSTSRLASAYLGTHQGSHTGGSSYIIRGPFWKDNLGMIDASAINTTTLNTPIPSVSINGSGASSPPSPSASRQSPASKNASNGGSGNGVEVNIFDGTGQKISEYDSSIRVQITERASRNNQFAALE